MASATEYLGQAANSILQADELWARQDRDGAYRATVVALVYVVIAIAIELGVPPPTTNGQPPEQILGQGTLPR